MDATDREENGVHRLLDVSKSTKEEIGKTKVSMAVLLPGIKGNGRREVVKCQDTHTSACESECKYTSGFMIDLRAPIRQQTLGKGVYSHLPTSVRWRNMEADRKANGEWGLENEKCSAKTKIIIGDFQTCQ